MLSTDQIARTEQRYGARASERRQTDALLEVGAIVEANGAEAVQRRLEHMGADQAAARRVINHIAAAPPEDMPPDFRIIASEGEPGPVSPAPDSNLSAAFLERILGTNELMEARFLEEGATVARCVGRIAIAEPNGLVAGYGTGVLIGPGLVMTNNHVLQSADSAVHSALELDYEATEGGRLKTAVTFRLDPEAFFVTDVHLDYTVVAVSRVSGSGSALDRYGWVRLNPTLGKVIKGERVNIVQHPNGTPKRVALRKNEISDMLDDFLHYRTDTAPGSSGSPVFNDEWEIIALHHSGVPQRDNQDRILSIDGTLWNSSMGETRIAWIANEGVRVSRIVAHLQAQRLGAPQRTMLRDAIDGSSTSSEDRVTSGVAKPLEQELPQPGVQVANLTIPLEITVRVGSGSAQTFRLGGDGQRSGGTVGISSTKQDRLREEAMSAIVAARERPYYDEDADTAARASWYASVDPDGHGPGWVQQLRSLVTERHLRRHRYSTKLRNEILYPWVDLREDMTVQSIYSNQAFQPEHFVDEDLRVDEMRTVRMQEVLSREATVSEPGQMRLELEALERSLPYNCEHVVCQSWFGEAEPMRGDLHHLFACDSRCNSFRKNTPYVDFPDFQEVIRDACGKAEMIMDGVGREWRGFEPSHGKGPAARATLYFLLRYPGETNVYCRDDISTLLGWHAADPVSLYERHRNAAIAEIQGNRNPFIDFPAWAERIMSRQEPE